MASNDNAQRLKEIGRELPGATTARANELLSERGALLESSALSLNDLIDAIELGSTARLPLITRRETARAGIQDLQQTRAALKTLRASSNPRRVLDLLG